MNRLSYGIIYIYYCINRYTYMKEFLLQIEERITELQKDPTDINIAVISELYLVRQRLCGILGYTIKQEIITDSFPITDVSILNDILNLYRFEDRVLFDLKEVNKKDYLDCLWNWELTCSHGYHDFEGDFAQYNATFTSPNGTKYYFEDVMSLLGDGWCLEKI